ncbi:MAG TPA: basic secretory protein-like protein [Verrucomicrobiae bacterium]|nr:basic secretory protein-like protein [Verrucomicrobiae bacterium]
MSSSHTHNLLFGLAITMLVTGCAATRSIKATNPHDPVRKVDFTKAPEFAELAERARQFGNATYPKVCALLLDESAQPPRQFDLFIAPLKSGNTGETHQEVRRIYLNSDYLTNSPDLNERVEKILVHEMAHMATQFHKRSLLFWKAEPPAIRSWCESIADYAFYKLVGTNGWGCPECNLQFPHYTSGYRCGGAFLLYLESQYGTNLVRELGATLSRQTYSDSFFVNSTGQSLDASWTEFQKTAAFKPEAKRLFELQQALGYVNGRPPRNVEKRFKKYVEQHADPFTKRVLGSAKVDGKHFKDIASLITVYLYFTQPGGTPEHLLADLRDKGELPGFAKGEKGLLTTNLDANAIKPSTFPVTRTLTGSKANDPSIYHYSLVCAAEGAEWKLEKAWRAGPDGKVIEELSLR